MGCQPGLSISAINIAFEAGTGVTDVARSFEYNERTIYRL